MNVKILLATVFSYFSQHLHMSPLFLFFIFSMLQGIVVLSLIKAINLSFCLIIFPK